MYKQHFLIYEKECKLYFCKKFLYGYNPYNQTVYKAQFTSDIHSAAKFTSTKQANLIIDMLPPTETFIHIPVSQDNLPIKLSNLVVLPITINYDS
jgi:hypothetical protein